MAGDYVTMVCAKAEIMKTETEIRRAANLLGRHWDNALERDDLDAAGGAASALSALMWAAGDDGKLAAAFEEMIDGTRGDLARYARRN